MSEITALVGPNEAGKSNTFEALYRINPANPQDAYNINEDWPVDDWGGKSSGAGKIVCHAVFELDADEIVGLYEFAKLTPPTPPAPVEGAPSPPVPPAPTLPKALQLSAWRTYTGATQFAPGECRGAREAA
ncbi:MAG: ATP-binding protein [Hyphomonadaceae bacterium]|nr:ATP-binding protein [Hyphomonadaceae bacterium]